MIVLISRNAARSLPRNLYIKKDGKSIVMRSRSIPVIIEPASPHIRLCPRDHKAITDLVYEGVILKRHAAVYASTA